MIMKLNDAARDLIGDGAATALLGSDEHFPPPNAPERLLTGIRVDRVRGLGPSVS
jgi:hypothetical protein